MEVWMKKAADDIESVVSESLFDAEILPMPDNDKREAVRVAFAQVIATRFAEYREELFGNERVRG